MPVLYESEDSNVDDPSEVSDDDEQKSPEIVEDVDSDVDDDSEVSEVDVLEPTSQKENQLPEKAQTNVNSAKDISDSNNEESEIESDVMEEDQNLPSETERQSGIIEEPVEYAANFFMEEITPDDEILTFQCPQNFNVKSLLNTTLDFTKNVTVSNDSGEEFSCQLLECSKDRLTCIFPKKRGRGGMNADISNVPIVGHLMVHKVIKLPNKRQKSQPQTEIALPAIPKTMSRHPILGLGWNDHISYVGKQLKKHKRLERKSLRKEQDIEKEEIKKKNKKRKLKNELSVLKKKIKLEIDSS